MFALLCKIMYCVHKIFVRINIKEITKPTAFAICSKEGKNSMYLISNGEKKNYIVIFDTSTACCQNNFIPTSYCIFV
jgi:hypothetical protein